MARSGRNGWKAGTRAHCCLDQQCNDRAHEDQGLSEEWQLLEWAYSSDGDG
jgi:hypothetical protein